MLKSCSQLPFHWICAFQKNHINLYSALKLVQNDNNNTNNNNNNIKQSSTNFCAGMTEANAKTLKKYKRTCIHLAAGVREICLISSKSHINLYSIFFVMRLGAGHKAPTGCSAAPRLYTKATTH